MKPKRMFLESLLRSSRDDVAVSAASRVSRERDGNEDELGRVLDRLDAAFDDVRWTTDSSPEECIAAYYHMHLPHIRRVAMSYANLDCAVDLDDLLQECYLAIYSAWRSYDPRWKFRNYLHFHLQKACGRAVIDDKGVIVPTEDGSTRVISYANFQRIKRRLPDAIQKRCIVVSLTLGLSSFEHEGSEAA